MLAPTLNQGNHHRNHKHWNIICTPCRSAAEMLLHINGKFTISNTGLGCSIFMILKAHLMNVTAVSSNIRNPVSLKWFFSAYHH